MVLFHMKLALRFSVLNYDYSYTLSSAYRSDARARPSACELVPPRWATAGRPPRGGASGAAAPCRGPRDLGYVRNDAPALPYYS